MYNPELAISAHVDTSDSFSSIFFHLNSFYSTPAQTLFLNSQPVKEKVGLPNGSCFLLSAHAMADRVS